MDKIMRRCDKVAYYQVDSDYVRMRGFTDFTMKNNPTEYTRKYVDEETERNDIVAYNPSISYAYDRFSKDLVHIDMSDIADFEMKGEEAVRTIIIVDKALSVEGGYLARKRAYTVIPDAQGSDSSAYTYSGTLKANGELSIGVASSTDNWQSVKFEEITE